MNIGELIGRPARRAIAIVAAMLAATLTVGLASVPAQAAGTRLNYSGVASRTVGHTIGPNAYTQYGKLTFKSYTQNGNFYDSNSSVVYVNPTLAAGTTTPSPAMRPGYVPANPAFAAAIESGRPTHFAPDGTYHPNSWYNPTTWNWSGLFGGLWTKFLQPCLKGISKGYVSAFSGAYISTAIGYFDGMSITPQGLAIVTLGSCIFGFSS